MLFSLIARESLPRAKPCALHKQIASSQHTSITNQHHIPRATSIVVYKMSRFRKSVWVLVVCVCVLMSCRRVSAAKFRKWPQVHWRVLTLNLWPNRAKPDCFERTSHTGGASSFVFTRFNDVVPIMLNSKHQISNSQRNSTLPDWQQWVRSWNGQRYAEEAGQGWSAHQSGVHWSLARVHDDTQTGWHQSGEHRAEVYRRRSVRTVRLQIQQHQVCTKPVKSIAQNT